MGWSEIQRYLFKVPSQGWAEVPVSIADLGGTEIDMRCARAQAVLPVMLRLLLAA